MANLDHKAILADALKLPPGERAAYLARVCGDDAAVRARIERLLKAVEDSGVFPPDENGGEGEAGSTFHAPAGLEGPGAKIGPYKLLQQIGEGGFGFVYMAEQHEPVRRKVALKIVKPGMDTREVIARFEAERQALALMDHPNIARVLDAGATDSGRPYFVMELVRGVSLTEYCDKNQLPTRERLELFTAICQAVQHAHQKGIIHRDLKPSNILVTLHDGKPVPKVIDFGVAKALNQQLTEKTLFTAYGQMVGTPQYMSPEQAEMSGLDVDTRSDIYSLGVLLYELLTGTTPLDSQQLRAAGFAEMQRLIREEEPPRPSTRISTLGAAATSVAQHRSADPRRLRQELKGELDWIVMKALEKDRNRRYASAVGLVDDVQRYLRDEAVLACPPSTAYRFQKFARRNKALLATVGAIGLVLLAGAALSTVMAVRAVRAEQLARQRLTGEIAARTDAEQARAAEGAQRRTAETERDRAESARQRATKELKHAVAAERQAQANFDQARATVDQYLTTVSESQLLTIAGMQPLRQAMLDAALAFYERFVAQRPEDPQLRAGLAAACARLGKVQVDLQQRNEGREYYSKAQQLYEALFKEGHATPEMERGLAEIYFWQGRYLQTVLLCQRRLRGQPEDHAAQLLLANTYNTLAVNDRNEANPRETLRLHRDAFRLRSALVLADPTNPEYLGDLGSTVNNVGVVLAQRGQRREALAELQQGVTFAERAFAAARYSVLYGRFLAVGRSNEAGHLAREGRVDEAIAARRRVVEVWQRLAEDNPALPGLRAEVSKAYRDLATLQRELKREAEAAETLLASRQLIENLPQETADDVYNLAVVYATLAKDAPPGAGVAAAGAAAEDLRTALRTLARAVTLGYRQPAALEKEPAFSVLKTQPEFQTLVKLVKLRERIEETAKDTKKLQGMPTLRAELEPLVGEPLAALPAAETLRTVADYLMRAGEAALAETDGQRALALLQGEASGSDSGDAAVAVETARTWQLLAQLHFRGQRYAEAVAAWQAARTVLDRSRQAQPDEERLKGALAAREYELAEAYSILGAFDGAREHYELGFAAKPNENSMIGLRHAAMLAGGSEPDAFRRLIKWLRTTFGEEQRVGDSVHIVFAESLEPPEGTSGRGLIARATRAYQMAGANPNSTFRLALGLACLRGEGHGMAADILADVPPGEWLGLAFYQSLPYIALGDISRAREQFAWGEAEYRRVMSDEILIDTHPAMGSFVQGIRTRSARSSFDVRVAQLARAEASAAIEGKPRPDPWQHLLAARGFGLLGDSERAKAEFALVEQAASDDPEVWIVRGRVHARLGDQAAAEQAFQRAIDLTPQQASSWIARGRYFTERGQQEKADADFAKAAALAPNRLQLFLDAGWWVAGPYPLDHSEACPPEFASPGASGAAEAATPGDPDAPLRWQSVAAEVRGIGRVPLGRLAEGATGLGACALAYVYTPAARTATLWLSAESPLELWLNGRLIHEAQSGSGYWQLDGERVPVVLRAGRNAILVKSRPGANLTVRFDDHPLQRSFEAARLGEWAEAAAHMAEALGQTTEDAEYPRRSQAAFLLAAGDPEGYRRLAAELLERYRASEDAQWAFGLAHICGLDPSGIDKLDLLMELAERGAKAGGQEAWRRVPIGLAYHRAGRWDELIRYFEEQRVELEPHRDWWPLLAMAHHNLGHAPEAREWLAKCRDVMDKEMPQWSRRAPAGFALVFLSIREAYALIEGSTQEVDERFAKLYETQRVLRDGFTPETVDFDAAIASEPNEARLYRARAEWRVELGRLEEAEQDFRRAVALKPDDAGTWLAFGQFSLGRGRWDDAAAALRQAGAVACQQPAVTQWISGYGRWDEATGRVEFQRLPYWDGGQWCGGPTIPDPKLGYLSLHARGGHPGNDPQHAAIRRWIAPRDGLIQIQGRLKHASTQGDGVRGRIVSSRQGVLVEQTAHQGEADTNTAEFRVEKGDFIDLIVDCQSNSGWDSFDWPVTVRGLLAEEPGAEPAIRIAEQSEQCFEAPAGRRQISPQDVLAAVDAGLTQVADVRAQAALLVLRSRLLAHLRQWNGAAADLDRAVERAPQEAEPWIARGRWRAERGQQEKADADFAQAAALTPNELNKFLEAGWWVVGPYPQELAEFCPPELEADPSKRVFVVDSETGRADQPVAWRRVATQSPDGLVKLGEQFGPSGARSVYALNYVFSPDERTATLWLSPGALVWVNGRRLEEPTTPHAWHWAANERRPFVLKEGRNAILVKQGAGEQFICRLGDNPIERGLEYFRFALYTEAANAFAEATNRNLVTSAYLGRFYPYAQLMEGNLDEYRRSVRELAVRFPQDFETLMAVGAHGPDGLPRETMEQLFERFSSWVNLEKEPWRLGQLWTAQLRLGQYQEIIDQVSVSGNGSDAASLAILSIAYHQLGQSQAAIPCLEQSRAQLERILDAAEGAVDYLEWPYLHYREACRLIKGDSNDIEQRYGRFRETRRKLWQAREPALADYIDAVRAAADQSAAHLARGRRLADLQRWKAAEADFNKAVELAPNDPDVLAARALYYADHGQPDKAAADFHAALSLLGDETRPRWQWGLPLDVQAVRYDDVYERLIALRPEDSFLPRTRMILRARQGRLEDAAADARKVEAAWTFDAAAVALLRGDRTEFERIRATAVPASDPYFTLLLLGLAPPTPEMTGALRSAADALAESVEPWKRRTLGIAQLRLGEYRQAVVTLEASMPPAAGWLNRIQTWPLLAIAHSQLGNREKARQYLELSSSALRLLEQLPESELSRIFGPPNIEPHDWLMARVYHREAQEMIGEE